MSGHTWEFAAVDTLFFRDGTPFLMADGSQAGAVSFFPPTIHTLQGAIRYVLATGQGWREGMPFPPELGGPHDLGPLRLQGPFLRYREQWLVPVPAPLLLAKPAASRQDTVDGAEVVRLAPGDPVPDSDLGAVRLPQPVRRLPGTRVTDMSGYWLTMVGLGRFLDGGVPAPVDLVAAHEMWRPEPRVGIQRELGTRRVVDGHLYAATHVRPAPDVAIAVAVSGVPVAWHPTGVQAIRLGGEGRAARLTVSTGAPPLPSCPALQPGGDGLIRYTLTLLTPARMGGEHGAVADEARQSTEQLLREGPGSPGRLVAVCGDRPALVGGWDMQHRRPRPLAPVVPAGTTWFFEADPGQVEDIRALHGQQLGDWRAYGYGQAVVGRWEEAE